ncbi:MAG: hypothetical protein DRN68_04465, partial [Thaumarchaeota archaeon]
IEADHGISLLGGPQVWVAFIFYSDYSITYEGTYLDAICIQKHMPECCDLSINDWWFEQNGKVIPPDCLDTGEGAVLHMVVENWCNAPLDVCGIGIGTTPATGARVRKTFELKQTIPPGTTQEITLPLDPEDLQFLFPQCGSYETTVEVWPCCDETYPSDNTLTKTINVCRPQWTVMVYMNGDNDLEGAAIDDLNEMEAVGSDDCLNIVVQLDRAPNLGYPPPYQDDTSNGNWTGCRRYYVTQDPNGYDHTIRSQLVMDLGEVDMGDPQTLVDFACWAIDNYPAEHYALVIWDHGGGWKLIELRKKGISVDDTDYNFIDLPGLEWALSQIYNHLGHKLDLIGYDACLMGMLEVAYASRQYADVMVGSEETEPGDGWDYLSSLAWLKANCETATAQQLADQIAIDYCSFPEYGPGVTQSTVDLGAITDLANAVDALANYVIGHINSLKLALMTAWSNVKRYWDHDFADLYDFCQLLYGATSDSSLRGLCQAVMNAVNNAVSYACGGTEDHGISIYLPTCGNYDDSYENIGFASATHWDEMLQAYQNYCGGGGECSIQVTAPTGDETLHCDQPYTIHWTSENAGDYVKIEFSPTGGDPWDTIAASTPNDGNYEWTVPDITPGSDTCVIRVCSTSQPGCCGTSEMFTIYCDSEETVSASDITVNCGSTGWLDVLVDTLPQGLSGYIITLTISPQGCARFTGAVEFVNPGTAGHVDSYSDYTITFRDTDFGNIVQPGATDVLLAQVEVECFGDCPCEVSVLVQVDRLEQDDGSVVNPNTENGSVACRSGCPNTPFPGCGTQPPNDLDGDDDCEDINGDGTVGFTDSICLSQNVGSSDPNNPVNVCPNCFDFCCNGGCGCPCDGQVGFVDAICHAWTEVRAKNGMRSPIRVEVSDITLSGVGEMGTGSVVVDELPTGLSGYIITLTIENEGVVRFTGNVEFLTPGAAGHVDSVSDYSITFRDTDFGNVVVAGATNVHLADVEVEAVGCDNETNIAVHVERLEDDTGAVLSPNEGSGLATVECQSGQPECWTSGVVQITANGSGTDSSNWFGVDPAATDCFDVTFDIEEPPTIAPYTSLWFGLPTECQDSRHLTKDIRFPIACEGTKVWTMKVTDDGPAEEVTLSWAPDQLPTGGCEGRPIQIFLIDTASGRRIDMTTTSTYTYTKQGNPDTHEFQISVSCGCATLDHILAPAGWHMIALPGELCPPCTYNADTTTCGDVTCALCDNLEPCYVFYYDPEQGGYVMAPPKENVCYHRGMGFWVRTYNDTTYIDAEVESTSEPVEVSLVDGWLQLGNPFDFSVSVSGFEVRCGNTTLTLEEAASQGWVSPYLFVYDPDSGGYQLVQPNGCIPPWAGFWFRSYRDGCTLIINPVKCPPVPPANQALSAEDLRFRGIEVPPPPPTLPRLAEQIRVVPVPNPVRDVHTTTFRVLGICPCSVQALKVEIYDLAGKLVWQGEVEGPMLAWHTENLEGLPLANGVYLYKAYVKINGEWIPAGVQKVAIFR